VLYLLLWYFFWWQNNKILFYAFGSVKLGEEIWDSSIEEKIGIYLEVSGEVSHSNQSRVS